MAMVVKGGAMLLASYKKFHPAARLSDEERKAFSDWALAEKQREFEKTIVGKTK